MARSSKPYQRSEKDKDNYRRGNPDAPGGWKHDLHLETKSSLASRLSSGSGNSAPSTKGGTSLLARIAGGQGKELLPSSSSNTRLHGFDGPIPTNINNLNSGVELLPSSGPTRATNTNTKSGMRSGPLGGRLVDRTGIEAALGRNQSQSQRRQPRELLQSQPQQTYAQPHQQQQQQQVSIMGAARATVWVRVANLAAGTTAEDVLSAFGHLPVLNAKVTSSTPSIVSVDIELETRQAAEELIKTYDGVIADGNTLRVTMVTLSLKDRMGFGAGAAAGAGLQVRNVPASTPAPQAQAQGGFGGRELLDTSSSGKLYSDTILSSNPRTGIVTLAENDNNNPRARNNADTWMRGAPSLASRMSKGRQGQIGAGSFHDMLMN